MRIFFLLALLITVFSPHFSFAEEASFNAEKVLGQKTTIRIFSGKKASFVTVHDFAPFDEEVRAELIYIHGLGDQALNHLPLFEGFLKAGIRVIAVDLPSHGFSKTGETVDLDEYTVHDLTKIIAFVEAQTRVPETNRPLFLAGYSLGATSIT